MKSLVLLIFLFAAVALIKGEIDWSKIKHKYATVQPISPPQFKPKIVGGKIADRHQFPHQVAIIIDGEYFCGGSIIKANKILTAAHCVDGAQQVEVTAGAHNLGQPEPQKQQTRYATKINIKIHDDWNPKTLNNDIAIINLQSPFVLNKFVTILALYRGNSQLVGVESTVSGWGRDSDQSQTISQILRYATSNIISNDICKKFFAAANVIPSVVCLDGSSLKGSCNGDSGGPLHIALDNQLFQAGIVSFGAAIGCELGYPSAYTRISSFLSWVDKNIK